MMTAIAMVSQLQTARIIMFFPKEYLHVVSPPLDPVGLHYCFRYFRPALPKRKRHLEVVYAWFSYCIHFLQTF